MDPDRDVSRLRRALKGISTGNRSCCRDTRLPPDAASEDSTVLALAGRDGIESRVPGRLEGGTESIVSIRRGNCGFLSKLAGDVISVIVVIFEVPLELRV